MTAKLIDLHLHTSCSDGRYSPADTIKRAKEKNLAAIAITDHDTCAAIDEAIEMAGEIEFITGVELSCQYWDTDFHMLAYFIDHKYAPLADKIIFYQQERLKRGELIVKKLNDLGLDLHMDTVKRAANKGAIGRPHVADALVKEEFVRTFDEAFSRYLGYHAPAYVPKTYFDPVEAIALVHEAGGIASLAHPGTVRKDDAIAYFKEIGLDGIEVYHSMHTPAQTRHYKKIAANLGLLITGGSDWHGRGDHRADMGSQKVPYSVLEQMKEYIATRQS